VRPAMVGTHERGRGLAEADPDVRLSVVVLSWNEWPELSRCLAALAEHAVTGGQEVIVVDNGSTDGTPALVRERFPDVTLVANATNRGVSIARNQGMTLARGRMIAMLDSDAYVTEGALDRLCDLLEADPAAGMVGPQLRYEDGSLQLSCRRMPTFGALVANRLARAQRFRDHPARRRYLMSDEPHDRVMDVEYLLGAAMVFRREARQAIGGFDERIAYGLDDCDWGLRMWAGGWRVVYLPTAVVVHHYRRRTARKPLSRQSIGLFTSYALVRRKAARRARRNDGRLSPS